MSKTTKRVFAAIMAVLMLGGVVLSAGIFKQASDTNSGGGTISIEVDYSKGLNDDGFIDGITAGDYIKLPDYESYEMPYELTYADEETLQDEVDYIIDNFTTQEKDTSTDKLIGMGTTVNIDYVGSVDGEEFSGGSTQGQGTDVTVGVTNYIDGFLDQLIGHKVGDEFDIQVTFPEDYGVENLNGKDAVFHIIINHLYKTVVPEINDEFVSASLSGLGYGETVESFYEVLERRIVDDQEKEYIWDRLIDEYEVISLPDEAVSFAENNAIANIAASAANYGYSYDDFLALAGIESTEAYLEANRDNIDDMAAVYTMVQAIAEKEGLKVSDEDIKRYFLEFYNTEDYSTFETIYGKPYIKMTVMMDKMLGVIRDRMPVADPVRAEDAGE